MRIPAMNRIMLAFFVVLVFGTCSKLERAVPEDTAAPSVLITSPDGGEVWYLNTVYNITWEASDDIGVVSCMLDFSLDEGLTWEVIQDSIEGNPGVYAWTVPDTVSTNCLVRVSCQDLVENVSSDTSDAVFTIWPEGGMIAFCSNRDNTSYYSIFTMYANGTNARNITNMEGPDVDYDPDWSPDCSKIVFRRTVASVDNEIFVMNFDGSDQINITNSPTTNDAFPVWSPLGDRIAFSSIRGGTDWDIWLMDPDGSNLSILTSTSNYNDYYCSWSPSGDQIAFHSNRINNSTYDVYVMNSDGSNPQILTPNTTSYHDSWPAWSPDGSLIAFCSNRNGANEIYTMNANGSNQQRLTNNSVEDFWPRWSPDGSRIVFMSYRTNDWEIWEMDPDGGNPTNISNNLQIDVYPSWSKIQ